MAAWAGLRGFLGQGYLPAGGAGPRLLLVPPYSGGSEPLGGFLLRAALDLGLTARLLDWPPELRRLAQAAKIAPWATAGGLLAGSALETARAAKDFRPDLILALAQAPLDAQGLALLRDEAPWARLAFWFVEDFNRFRYVSGVAPAYDLFFHIQGRLMDGELRDWGLARAWYLPLAADASLFRPQPVPERFRAKLSLAGAGYPNRRAILADLAQNFWARGRWGNYRFRIFGSGWEGCPEVLARHLFEGGRRLTAEECALAYAGGEVNLNLHSGNGSGFDGPSAFVNPRTFELAASQSLQIVDDRLLLEGLFGPGELEIVRDPAQLPEAIEKHLNDPELGRDMALRARRRVLREHLYAHRLRFILGCL
jgi:spore maturation protein CgeB